MLEQVRFIDGYVALYETSCFRPDGSLAFFLSEMHAPNFAPILDDDPANDDAPEVYLSREGRLYFAPEGALIDARTRITLQGREVAPMDNADYALARPCSPAELHMTADDVRIHLDAELGDITGNHPVFEPAALDWCAMAAP